MRYSKMTVAIAAIFVCRSASAQHAADIWIGNSGGQLAISPSGMIPGQLYNPVLRVDTFIRGWSNNNPGFDHVVGVQGGVSALSGPVQVRLEVISLDPALFVIDNSFNVLDSPGDRTLLGGAALHTHLTWFIDEDDSAFDSELCVWEGVFRLVDTGTGLAASLPFSLLFTNVPVRGGEFPPTPAMATGDFNHDHVLDQGDLAAFELCTSAPDQFPAPDDPDITTCEVDCHNAFDFDDDLDIDLRDFAEFQTMFGS